MLRRLFMLLSALSLLLFVGACVLWVRSFFLPTAYRFPYHGELCEVVLDRGRIGVSNAPEVVGQAIMRRPGGKQATTTTTTTTSPPRPQSWSGSSRVIAPVLILLFLVPPAQAVRKRRDRLNRRRAGLCLACGYDLRATPNQCPECGAVPQVKMSSDVTPSI